MMFSRLWVFTAFSPTNEMVTCLALFYKNSVSAPVWAMTLDPRFSGKG